jgi:predicted esterase
MNSVSHFLSVSKTARYYTLGELSETTREIWLVLHGYAQLAGDFIQSFSVLSIPDRLIIAPEGLNRFYAKGFGGKPVASWMTSESREEEITDYVNYLNTLVSQFQLSNSSAQIVLLGFSQGVAAASRWLHQTNLPVSKFIICSGEIASELQNPISQSLIKTPLVYITGTKDNLISQEKQENVNLFMKGLNATQISFEGGHVLNTDLLLKL